MISLKKLIIGLCVIALPVGMLWAASHPIRSIAYHITPTDRAGHVQVILRIARPFDPDEQVGLAHYAEHLAWYAAIGKAARGPDRHSGAWTSHRAIFYSLSGKPEDLPQLTATLARVFDPIALEPGFAEEEREIIQREYQMVLGQSTTRRADEALSEILHAGTQLGPSIIGTPAQIDALTYDAARAYHRAPHRPEHAAFIFRGNVGRLQVWRALMGLQLNLTGDRRVSSDYDMGPELVHLAEFPDPSAAPRMIWQRVVALKTPVPFDLLEAQLDHLRGMLDTNLPGGLAGPLRFDARIVRGFRLDLTAIDEGHIEMRFQASPDAGISLTALRTTFEATLADIATRGIPEPTYERVMARMENYWPDWGDRVKTRRWMAEYTTNRVLNLRQPLPTQDLRQLQSQISADGLNIVLSALSQTGRTAIAFIGSQENFR